MPFSKIFSVVNVNGIVTKPNVLCALNLPLVGAIVNNFVFHKVV